MCGIIGITNLDEVVYELYQGLIALQHRGQDTSGIVTFDNDFLEEKGKAGLVIPTYDERTLSSLTGRHGIGHVRYATIGITRQKDAQPFYATHPFGVVMAQNGNVTNYTALRDEIFMNTTCDGEAIMNVFMTGVEKQRPSGHVFKVMPQEIVFKAVEHVMKTVEGSYSMISYLPKVGMVAFRDPFGIKPLAYGRKSTAKGDAYCFVSETVALDNLGYSDVQDVKPGEAVIVDDKGNLTKKEILKKGYTPCIFEWIYFARGASIIDGISVSGFRYRLGKELAHQAIGKGLTDSMHPDFVTDVPSTATRGALSFSEIINGVYRPLFDRNNYVGRSFIESSDAERKRAVMLKQSLDTGILLEYFARLKRPVDMYKIDDSFVRGITNRLVNENIRETGKVGRIVDFSLSPHIRHICPYGIDMAITEEFVAVGKNDEQIADFLKSDAVMYQTREGLDVVARRFNLRSYCDACFSGNYPTGLTEDDLKRIERERLGDKNDCGHCR